MGRVKTLFSKVFKFVSSNINMCHTSNQLITEFLLTSLFHPNSRSGYIVSSLVILRLIWWSFTYISPWESLYDILISKYRIPLCNCSRIVWACVTDQRYTSSLPVAVSIELIISFTLRREYDYRKFESLKVHWCNICNKHCLQTRAESEWLYEPCLENFSWP
jgi:hypothetical protein